MFIRCPPFSAPGPLVRNPYPITPPTRSPRTNIVHRRAAVGFAETVLGALPEAYARMSIRAPLNGPGQSFRVPPRSNVRSPGRRARRRRKAWRTKLVEGGLEAAERRRENERDIRCPAPARDHRLERGNGAVAMRGEIRAGSRHGGLHQCSGAVHRAHGRRLGSSRRRETASAATASARSTRQARARVRPGCQGVSIARRARSTPPLPSTRRRLPSSPRRGTSGSRRRE